MKKLALVVAAILLVQTIFAAGSVTTLNVNNGSINISGINEGDGYITAKLENEENLIYFTQTEASSDEFSFEIKDIGLEGDYALTVTGEDFKYSKTITLPNGGSYIENEPEEETTAVIDGLNSLMIVNRVKVSGVVKNYAEDKTVTLILYKGSDTTALNESDIGYIQQTSLLSDGSFEFEFTFKGNIEEYSATVFSSGVNGETEIMKSETIYSYVSATTEIVSAGNSVTLNALIKNDSMNCAEYTLILMFYDESGTLIDVSVSDKKTMTETEKIKTDTLTVTPPENVAKVYATVWSSFDTIVPYTEGTETEI